MTVPILRFRGAIAALTSSERSRLLDRNRERDAGVRSRTAEILKWVRRDGDRALIAIAHELDGVALESIEVPRARCREALEQLAPALRSALERAARNIATVHRAQLPSAVEVETEPGVVVGRRPDPLARVGLYAPGGRASYPSSVLMTAVPARVAQVGEIVLCSPPDRSGEPSALVLAAAEIAGVNRVFAVGGAGAIAAMAYGTETVPRVERIVGPGNAYVAEAKLQVAEAVSIDSPAGPSELLVILDGAADPARIVRELLAQAEHDPDAAALAVAIGEDAALAVADALRRAIPEQERAAIIAASLAARGGVLSAVSLEEAIEFANAYAPEHLLLAVKDPESALARVRNAGAAFLGETSAVVFGDYLTGGNHTLPTGGAARSYSGLSSLDFLRWTSYQRVTPDAAARLADDTAALAVAERLPAHAAAAAAWSAVHE